MLSPNRLIEANREAIYNLYLYLSDKIEFNYNMPLFSVLNELEKQAYISSSKWKPRDFIRLNIFKNAVINDYILAFTTITKIEISKEGATVACFKRPNGEVSVVFKGTGSGEWLDNGEGLSGIPETNTYITYKNGLNSPVRKTVIKDFATDMQADALNWFNRTAYQNGWDNSYSITVSGHSKGGNKAQFIAMNSDLIDVCYSFDGQGFSPEALLYFKNNYGNEFNKRRAKIFSLSAENDYVNVLGNRLMQIENIYYFQSENGLHFIEAILSENGTLNSLTKQGKLSRYIEDVSNNLMSLPPKIRRYATMGVMNIFKKHLGKKAENSDTFSDEETLAGIVISISALINNIKK